MLHIIKKPIITEKTQELNGIHKVYAFEVDKTANKRQIALAIEKMFNVDVESVRTVNVKGKNKTRSTRRGVMKGRTKHRKKAYVRLKTGQEIDIVSGEASE